MSRHMIRISAPRTWPINRKQLKFAAMPRGSHPMEKGLPIALVLRDLLHLAGTAHEVKRMLNIEEILVDGKRVKDLRRTIGLFDILSIPKLKEHYRIIISRQGKIAAEKVTDGNIKPCRIIGKTLVAGKMQLNLHDGKNIFGDAKYRVGDTLLLEIPGQKIVEHVKLDRGCFIYITGGKHLGSQGVVESITDGSLVCSSDEQTFLMPKQYAFALGKGKSMIQPWNKS